jgi:hypothetical protein
MAAGGIFVSYRRDDSRHAAGRLADGLADHFGPARIFRDIEAIAPGSDFTVALDRALASCSVMVVVIGSRWLDMAGADGQRRLDRPDDWIRQEIAVALQRGIPVVPVLLEGTPMPDAAQLPESIRALGRRQALELSDTRWRDDVQRLVRALELIVPAPPAPPAPPPPPPPGPPEPSTPGWWKTRNGKIGLWVGAAVLIVGGLVDQQGGGGVPSPAPSPSPLPPPPGPAMVVAGTWQAATGVVFEFAQQGEALRFRISRNAAILTEGQGSLSAGRMVLQMMVQPQPGGQWLNTTCELQATPDGRGFSGGCSNAAGSFAERLYR